MKTPKELIFRRFHLAQEKNSFPEMVLCKVCCIFAKKRMYFHEITFKLLTHKPI